ncbi:MAG: sodium:solute symporter [Thermoguttaceae bacterium]
MPTFDGILFAQSSATLGIYDWGTLIAYFAMLLGVAWWVVRQKTDTSQDYFLAGKKMGWLVIGASLFASNIGSEHLVGLAGTGASDGMAMAHYELHAWCLLVLGWVMVPFYERSCVYTMPEFLERRYCTAARWFLSLVSLIAYILTKISVTLFAGGIVFNALFPVQLIAGIDNFWVGAIGMVVLTGLYTILGGLRAVLFTELFQTVVLLVGAAAVLIIGLWQVGGWEVLRETVQDADRIYGYKIVENMPDAKNDPVFVKDETGKDIIIKRPKNTNDKSRLSYIAAADLTKDDIEDGQLKQKLGEKRLETLLQGSNNCNKKISDSMPVEDREKADHFNLWKPNSHPAFPWFGLLFGAPIVGLWYWTTDQYIVQRTLSAKNQTEARRGTIFGAYLKLAPVFIFIVPGMIAYGLAVQGKIAADVLYEPNQAFPILVKEVLPVGLKGLVVGGLLAALMSSLASVFNSCSTLFTMDIYQKIHPKSSERNLVFMGRIATAVIVILGLLWIPIIRHMPGTLYGYLQSVQAYIAPPIFAVFFLGVFFKRINAYGCMTGLIVGFLLGMLRLAAEILNNTGAAANVFVEGSFAHWFATTSFTFVCIYLTIACSALIVAVSLVTPKPKDEQLIGLTYATSTPQQRSETRASWNAIDVVLTCGLIVIILGVYIYFTG